MLLCINKQIGFFVRKKLILAVFGKMANELPIEIAQYIFSQRAELSEQLQFRLLSKKHLSEYDGKIDLFAIVEKVFHRRKSHLLHIKSKTLDAICNEQKKSYLMQRILGWAVYLNIHHNPDKTVFTKNKNELLYLTILHNYCIISKVAVVFLFASVNKYKKNIESIIRDNKQFVMQLMAQYANIFDEKKQMIMKRVLQ